MKDEILDGGRRLDDNGVLMPWYTSECLEWLEKLEFPKKKFHKPSVFEYGIGDSTLWYDSRGAFTHGVESNKEWHDHVVNKLCSCDMQPLGQCACGLGKRFVLTEDETTYLSAVHGRLYDIIVIDGLFRDRCFENAIEQINMGGYIILDNWKQQEVEPDWPITEEYLDRQQRLGRRFIKDVKIYKDVNHKFWQTLVVSI